MRSLLTLQETLISIVIIDLSISLFRNVHFNSSKFVSFKIYIAYFARLHARMFDFLSLIFSHSLFDEKSCNYFHFLSVLLFRNIIKKWIETKSESLSEDTVRSYLMPQKWNKMSCPKNLAMTSFSVNMRCECTCTVVSW